MGGYTVIYVKVRCTNDYGSLAIVYEVTRPRGGDCRRYRRRQALASSEGRAQGFREGVRVDTTGGGERKCHDSGERKRYERGEAGGTGGTGEIGGGLLY